MAGRCLNALSDLEKRALVQSKHYNSANTKLDCSMDLIDIDYITIGYSFDTSKTYSLHRLHVWEFIFYCNLPCDPIEQCAILYKPLILKMDILLLIH